MFVEDDMIMGDELMEIVLNKDLEQQICGAIDPRFLLQLVCHTCYCSLKCEILY